MTTTEQPGQFAEHPAEGAHERDRAHVAVLEPEAGITPRAANPAMIGVPLFVVGSLALAFQQVGFVSATALGAPIAIIVMATGLGTLVTALWSAAIGENVVAGIFGIFAGFWLSYAALVLGLTHGWYGLEKADSTGTVELFLIVWLVVVVLLTIGTLRLPAAFTLLFGLIDLSLLATLLATVSASTTLASVGGYLAFAFAAVGAYLYLDACSQETGGKALPLGRPVLH